jgi:catechol 2,3-dioxygenase-like lactoylglutathione lyase family enzyme
MNIESIDHVNIVVTDLAGMTAFYRDVLGMQVTKEVTIHGQWIDDTVGLSGVMADVVYLELPAGPRVELIRYRTPAGTRPPHLEKPNSGGLRHMAFRVSDIDAAAAELRAAGVKVGEVQTVPSEQVRYAGGVRKRLLYFYDPEQNLLELCEYRSVR